MTDLEGVIGRIRSGISRSAYPNETAVRTQVVQPILHALGWDVYDPDRVCAEYTLKLKAATRRIDLALCVSDRNPRCIIELKSMEYGLKQIGGSDGDRQLFEYSFHAGAPLALLTNGVNWRFYSTQSAGTYAERLVSTLDLETDPTDVAAMALDRYLAYANTESGRAADYAREDLNARIDRHRAREAIPRAWAHLIEGELDHRLAALLVETVRTLTEGAPTHQDIADFLRRLKPDDGNRLRKATDRGSLTVGVAAHARAQEPTAQPRTDRSSPPSAGARSRTTGAIRYWLHGEEQVAKNAKEAYVAIFAALAERDSEFLTRIAPRLRGRKNRGVAQRRRELSSNDSAVSTAAPLPGGWWLFTHMSNAQKMRALRVACGAAGIRFGLRTGLDITLPNA